MLALYGSCNYSVGYGNSAGKTELLHIARVIGFPGGGHARGFDTSIINPVDGTYVEYVRNPLTNGCRIFYKRHEKMDYGDKTSSVSKVKNFPVVYQTPWVSYSPANVKQTDSNKGRLHEVKYIIRLKNFTI